MTVGATKEPRTGSKNKTLIPHFQLKNRRKQLHSIEKMTSIHNPVDNLITNQEQRIIRKG